MNPFVIGIAGGGSSGKTDVLNKIVEKLGLNEDCCNGDAKQVAIIGQECFYRDLDEDERKKADSFQFDFDHPEAFDLDLMRETLDALIAGENVTVHEYDFEHNCRREEPRLVRRSSVIICHGILIFHEIEIRNLFNLKLFVDTDADVRLAARVIREVKEYKRDIQKVLAHYEQFVKPAYEEFCLSTKKYADVIIPRGADNEVAINLIVQRVNDLLSPRSPSRVRHVSETGKIALRPH